TDDATGYGPIFEEEPVDVVYTEDSPDGRISMNCRARANPPATYRWRRDNWEIKLMEQPDEHYSLVGGNLVINSPKKRKHAGTYICVARNIYGTVISKEARLKFGCERLSRAGSSQRRLYPLTCRFCLRGRSGGVSSGGERPGVRQRRPGSRAAVRSSESVARGGHLPLDLQRVPRLPARRPQALRLPEEREPVHLQSGSSGRRELLLLRLQPHDREERLLQIHPTHPFTTRG
ncbi:unnamed protein product, partial [Tetraodon nigroviridis]